MSDILTLETDDRGVCTMTLNRPDKHNALSADLMDALTAAAAAVGADPKVRVVVLTGAGESFCAGGDLRWMQEQMQAGDAQRDAAARKLAEMLFAMNTMPKPLIGRVQGQAFGGGIGMMSVCDVAIGIRGPKFGLTETRLGLIPATIGPYVCARMGEAMARRVYMSARLFDADEAVTLGLLAKAVAPEDLDAAVEAEVLPYLSCAPGAVAAAKEQLRGLGPRIDAQVIDDTIERLALRWASAEAQEGISAFFEKRKPNWR